MAKKILIADDEKNIRDVASIILSREGFHALSAETCEDAVQLARQELPDLIILDAQFLRSRLQGVDACRMLKENSRTKEIRIIGSSSPYAYEDEFLGAGAEDYLPKPYTPEQLKRKIMQYMGGS